MQNTIKYPNINKLPITSANVTLVRIIKESGYDIKLDIGGKPDYLVILKSDNIVAKVNLDETVELLLNRSHTYRLYINRQTSGSIKLDNITSKKLKVSNTNHLRIKEEYRTDTKILFNLVYHRAIRQAIQQSKELRQLFQITL